MVETEVMIMIMKNMMTVVKVMVVLKVFLLLFSASSLLQKQW